MKQILRISKVCFFFFDGIVFALAFISFSSRIIPFLCAGTLLDASAASIFGVARFFFESVFEIV